MHILATIFAGLLGLAFGSFLNVCVSRWPEGESVVHPHSHCRNCDHTLSWWENIPLLSWLILRGRCRNCKTAISGRYPLIEASIAILWADSAWNATEGMFALDQPLFPAPLLVAGIIGLFVFYWLLVALAALDAEHLWLPDFLTWPGIALGIVLVGFGVFYPHQMFILAASPLRILCGRILAILAAAALILLIRWIYKLIRHREGIGLGDAKLMALLAAWLGLPGALLAFGIGTIIGAVVGVFVLITHRNHATTESLATTQLPLGTFLCIGGIISSLWGQPILSAYTRWAGF